MKITKELFAFINNGETCFSQIENANWTRNLADVIPAIGKFNDSFKISITVDVVRDSGWYWVKLSKDRPFSPLYWNGTAWWRYDTHNCGDEGVYEIRETRIPEPTDG